jgi:hypothetical protein
MTRLPAPLLLLCVLGCTPTRPVAQVSATVSESSELVKATEPKPASAEATASARPKPASTEATVTEPQKPEDPAWLEAINELRRQVLDRSGKPAWERSRVKVDLLVAAVAADDPRYAEAHCTWAEMGSFDSAKHLLLALDSIRAKRPDAADRFRSLDHTFLATYFTWEIGPRGMLDGGPWLIGSAERSNACRKPDEALLRYRLIYLYRSQKGNRKRAARELRALFDDVSKALGPKHAYLASLYELAWYYHCSEPSRRILGPACPGRGGQRVRGQRVPGVRRGRGLQVSLQIRQAELGEDHPLTRESTVHLAASYWLQGRRTKVPPLLEKLMSGNLSDEFRTTATMLMALLDEAAGKREQALELMDRAASTAPATLVNNSSTHYKLHIMRGEIQSLAGRHRDAVASYRAARSLMPPLPWVKKRNAELLRAAGMHEQALVEYNSLILTEETTSAGTAMTQHMMNRELIVFLRARRDLLLELGRATQDIEKENRRILNLEQAIQRGP